MKTLALCILLTSFCYQAQAKVVSSDQLTVSPSTIDKVVHLVDKSKAGSFKKKLSILVTDSGLSTDVSPRYTVFLGYSSMTEMGNIFADFKINDRAVDFLSASRKSPGVYQVKVTELRDDGMYEVTQTIDATQMFIDESDMRKSCGDNFCDATLKTKISISETSKKLN